MYQCCAGVRRRAGGGGRSARRAEKRDERPPRTIGVGRGVVMSNAGIFGLKQCPPRKHTKARQPAAKKADPPMVQTMMMSCERWIMVPKAHEISRSRRRV